MKQYSPSLALLQDTVFLICVLSIVSWQRRLILGVPDILAGADCLNLCCSVISIRLYLFSILAFNPDVSG